MHLPAGIILVDGNEIIIKIDDQPIQARDLTPFVPRKPVAVREIVEIIAETLLSSTKFNLSRWHIYTRGVEDSTVRELAHALNYPIIPLTLKREQELLCRSLLVV